MQCPRRRLRLVAIFMALTSALMSGFASAQPAYVAIIIDDMGNNLRRGQQAIELPGPITYAVLPHTRYATSLAKTAHESSKEVIVHLPMANLTNHPLGPGALTSAQNKADFLDAVKSAIEGVPYAQGINNHTGSYLTQQEKQMTWLMEALKQHDLFFVDSRTTEKSIAYQVARNNNVLSSRRDVFLDNEQTLNGIEDSFKKLIRKAKQKGTAIAIGHPYSSTLAFLAVAIPTLEAEGIKVVSASELIAIQKSQQSILASAEDKLAAE